MASLVPGWAEIWRCEGMRCPLGGKKNKKKRESEVESAKCLTIYLVDTGTGRKSSRSLPPLSPPPQKKKGKPKHVSSLKGHAVLIGGVGVAKVMGNKIYIELTSSRMKGEIPFLFFFFFFFFLCAFLLFLLFLLGSGLLWKVGKIKKKYGQLRPS